MGTGRRIGKMVGGFAKKQARQMKEDSSSDELFRYKQGPDQTYSPGEMIDTQPDKPHATTKMMGLDQLGRKGKAEQALEQGTKKYSKKARQAVLGRVRRSKDSAE